MRLLIRTGRQECLPHGVCSRLFLATFVLAAVLGNAVYGAEPSGNQSARQLWIYCPTNLLVNEKVDKLEALWRRGAKVGYTHVLIADSKFSRLGELPKEYFRNVERVTKIAADLKLELVPAVFPIGWSNDLLGHDPNLAEGLPVRDALFVVKAGEARVEADPPVNLPASFADLKKWGFHDDCVSSDGDAAKMTDPNGRVSRVITSVKVAPFRQYHISTRIKTQDFHGTPEIKVIGGERTLNYNDWEYNRRRTG